MHDKEDLVVKGEKWRIDLCSASSLPGEQTTLSMRPKKLIYKMVALKKIAVFPYQVHPSKSLSEKFESVHNFFTR